MKRIHTLISFVALLASIHVSAQDVAFMVKVNSDSVLLGHRVFVDFELENSSGHNFQAPAFEGFTVQSGPNISSSTQIINGDVRRSTTYSFALKTEEIGVFYIGSALIETDEGNLETEPLEVIVHPNPDNLPEPRSNAPRSLFDFDSFFDSPFKTPNSPFGNEPLPKRETPAKPKRKTYKL